jgi:cell division protein FtsI/penicillin-binding protein 2
VTRSVLNTKKHRLSVKKVGTKKYVTKKKKFNFSWYEWLKQAKISFQTGLVRKKPLAKKLASRNKSKKPLPEKAKPRTVEKKPVLRQVCEVLFKILVSPFSLVFLFGVKVFGLNNFFNLFSKFGREKIASLVLILLFGLVGVRLAFIQIPYVSKIGADNEVFATTQTSEQKPIIIPANRGNIFARDINRSDRLYQLTSNQSRFRLVFSPSDLQKAIELSEKQNTEPKITAEYFSTRVSASANLKYEEIKNKVDEALEKNQSKTIRYSILSQDIDLEQRDALLNLIRPPVEDKKFIFPSFRNFISLETLSGRNYPERTTLGSTIGFTSSGYSEEQANKIAECREMIKQNKARQTEDSSGYIIGQYGVERAFCSELSGVNGKITYSEKDQNMTELQPVDGTDIVLTIDKNLQTKAEEVLAKAVEANANQNGKPISGTVLVVQANSGKILAQANYPNLDPNAVTRNDIEDGAVKNQAAIAYDPGSVIKPLTVATARQVYEEGRTKADGTRLGVPLDFKATDVDQNGKVFYGADGREYPIFNANRRSFKDLGPLSLSDVLRNSVNTLIATIQKDHLDTRTTREYFLDRFKLGDSSDSFLFSSDLPNAKNFDDNINSPFSYANMAFGQGFTTTPLNLVRAYSALANDGKLVEPRIVEKMSRNGIDIPVEVAQSEQVLKPEIAREVRQMMQNVVERGFGAGSKPSLAKMEHYTAGAKTGTAQIARPIIKIDENGDRKVIPCSYSCNTNLGLFDHTFIGFAPVNKPQVIVLVKLSQPKPGDNNNNYAEFSTAPFWREMTEYTLEYLGTPKDR